MLRQCLCMRCFMGGLFVPMTYSELLNISPIVRLVCTLPAIQSNRIVDFSVWSVSSVSNSKVQFSSFAMM